MSNVLLKFLNYVTGNTKTNKPMNGPYDSSTLEGLGANWGKATAAASNDGSIFNESDPNAIKEVQYAMYDDDSVWSVNSSLAFSKEAIDGLDSDKDGKKDGKLTVDDKYWSETADYYNTNPEQIVNPDLKTDGKVDKQKLFDVFNLNSDKEIDAAEYTAFMCYQDTVAKAFDDTTFKGKADDGLLSEDESVMGLKKAVGDPDAKGQLTELYEGYDLAEHLKNFKMPEKTFSSDQ